MNDITIPEKKKISTVRASLAWANQAEEQNTYCSGAIVQ
jgi:hypothetical protein